MSAVAAWLSGTPANWEILPVKRIARRIQTGSTPATGEDRYYEEGTIPWFGPSSFSRALDLSDPVKFVHGSAVHEGKARLFEAGSCLVVTIGATLGKAGLLPCDGSANQQVTAITFQRGRMLPRFGAYQLKALEEFLRGNALYTTLPIMDQTQLAAVPIVVPPIEAQRAIASFLDRKTAAIDALIAKKERLIELLQEKRQALITQAVTKGLDPNVKMKESGVEWLGEVPAHWRVARLKHAVVRVVDCPHDTPEYSDTGPALVARTADLDLGRLRLAQMRRCSAETYRERSSRMQLRPGDVLYSREGERFGMAATVPPDTMLCLGQRMMAFRVGLHTDHTFLMWALNSAPSYAQVTQDTVGATSPRANIPTIVNLILALPPLKEQHELACWLDRATYSVDGTADALGLRWTPSFGPSAGRRRVEPAPI